MNQFFKATIAGLVLSTTTAASAVETHSMKQYQTPNVDQAVDAMDFAGGSKLKDRMIETQQEDQVIVIRILLDA